MLRRYFKLPQKDVGVPQVAVSSSFCCTVTKFFSYEQTLLDKGDTENNNMEQRCFYSYLRGWRNAVPAHEKLRLCESFPGGSGCCRGYRRFGLEQRGLRAPSRYSNLPCEYKRGQTLLHFENTRKDTVLCSRSLVVLGCLPQCHHHLLWKISRFSTAPADAFAFGVVHITKVIQRSCLTHLTQTQGESAAVKELFPHTPQGVALGSCVFLTLSLMSLAMSKCLWQQTTASSNLPSTFNVLPRFPLALASPSRSPIVLADAHVC